MRQTDRQTDTVCLSSLSVDEILERDETQREETLVTTTNGEDETTTDEMSELTFSYRTAICTLSIMTRV